MSKLTAIQKKRKKQIEQELSVDLLVVPEVEIANFERIGKNLATIRDEKLYFPDPQFSSYYQRVFKLSSSRVYQFIDAYHVMTKLRESKVTLLPKNEAQCRELAKREDNLVQIWNKALEITDRPSNKVIREVSFSLFKERLEQKLISRNQVSCPFPVGSIVSIKRSEHSQFTHCWGYVCSINNFTVTVQTWCGQYLSKIEDLDSVIVLDQKSFKKHCDRLYQLFLKLEEQDVSVKAFLNELGKSSRVNLSSVEIAMLDAIEQSLADKASQRQTLTAVI
ncbi:hypothetical protein [Aphanothece hegewaldii]|uniref:hypothetical protein n=1 Tax=Aphanothece hegewaldii TaxID=1521625 RepID=UPI0011B1CCB0|nr:hypothetical protein [Aphanothece hegewaldii]